MYVVVICIYYHKHVYASIYIFTNDACRYLGLFGDHIVPSVLYRYTQVLRRADLVNSKGKPLVTNARLEAVWKRLADRLSTKLIRERSQALDGLQQSLTVSCKTTWSLVNSQTLAAWSGSPSFFEG